MRSLQSLIEELGEDVDLDSVCLPDEILDQIKAAAEEGGTCQAEPEEG